MGVAWPSAGSADGACSRKLTLATAVLIRVVTYCVVPESACAGVATLVVATTSGSAAIALFVSFYNAVATSLASNGADVPVVGKTSRLDTVASKCRANVSNGTGRKARDAPGGRGIHDETLASVTSVCAERATLLCADGIRVGTRIRGTVVHSAVRVTRLMCNNLPLGGRLDDDVGAGNSLGATSRVPLRAFGTGLSQPRQPDGRSSIAGREKGPVRERVALLASPLGELVQAVLNGDAAAAGLIPGRCRLLRGRTVGLGDDQVGQAKGDVEGALEELGRLVDLVNDILLRLIFVPAEGLDVGAVGGHAHERDPAGARTALGLANRLD